jgi:hypothetical protein
LAGRLLLKATRTMRNLIVTYLIIRAARTNKAKGVRPRGRRVWFPNKPVIMDWLEQTLLA